MLLTLDMFELEDYDLDDEVFLNTQIPSVTDGLPSSSHLSFEDDNKIFFHTPNPVIEVETSLSQKDEIEYNSSEVQKKNNCNIPYDIPLNTLATEQKSKSVSKYQSNKMILNFDDGFDSDDEVFFNTPDILLKSINSSNTYDNNTELKSNKDLTERVCDFNPENHESIYKSSNFKNNNKSDFLNHSNTTVMNVKSITQTCVSRKFPGPAGLLSESTISEDLFSEDPSNLESLDVSINVTENEKNEENLCSLANDSSFSSSPYQQFLSDFFMTDVEALLEKYNVAWVKQKLLPYTASGRFFTDKIPFFVSIIKEIDCLSPDPTVLLADKTGQIRGTIHRAVWNQFSSQLKLGAVLILSKVGVSCQKIVKGFTLNITSDHLIAIYCSSSEDLREVIVTRTTDLTNEEIITEAKRLNLFSVEALNKNPHSEIKSRMTVLSNLPKILSDQNSQSSNTDNNRPSNLMLAQSTPIKNVFIPKTPVAHNLFKVDECNLPEEPPSKRIRNEECHLKAEENYLNNEMSIIQNVFDGIDENEMFDDFCC